MTAQPVPAAATFQALTLEEGAVVDLFIDVLKREQQALVDGNIDLLMSLADEKAVSCRTLDQFARRRLLLLSSAGFPCPPGDLTAWLKKQEAAVQDAWQTLLAKAKEAFDLNRQNGQLIGSRMQNNRQALTMLLEISDRAAVYGPDGQPRPRSGGRILGTC